jgi:hypothetical protein
MPRASVSPEPPPKKQIGDIETPDHADQAEQIGDDGADHFNNSMS